MGGLGRNLGALPAPGGSDGNGVVARHVSFPAVGSGGRRVEHGRGSESVCRDGHGGVPQESTGFGLRSQFIEPVHGAAGSVPVFADAGGKRKNVFCAPGDPGAGIVSGPGSERKGGLQDKV